MNKDLMLSPEEVKRLTGFKKFIFVFLTIIIVALGVAYHLPDWARPLVKPQSLNNTENHEANQQFEKEITQLKSENKRISEQLLFYKKKASKTQIVNGASEIYLPNLITNYMSWGEWQKQNEGKTFADFRTAQSSFFKSEIIKAQAVFNKIKNLQH